jgi:kynurenine formamidase
MLSKHCGLIAWFAVLSLWTNIGWSQVSATKVDSVLELPLKALLEESVSVLDLGYSLNDRSPFWPGDDYEPFKLRTIATLEKNGVLSKAFAVPEHFGTHVDAPNHFERNQPGVDELRPRDLFGPGVVIDVAMQAEVDADYRASLSDVEAWERVHGKIPDGAIVFLKSGWGQHWKNPARYRNQDSMGVMHFPGFSIEAAKFLIERRAAKALAIDTLSIDHGPSKNFVVHHAVNGAGRYAVENVAQLDKLPPRDFLVIVAPIKIESGSGGPARVFAMMKAETSAKR